MSSPQLKPFEGPDPVRLLERIHEEIGPEARITRGETVRSGGLLGFFAQERYRLYVETPPGYDPARRERSRRVRLRAHRGMAAHRSTPEVGGAGRPGRDREPGHAGDQDIFSMLVDATADADSNEVAVMAPPTLAATGQNPASHEPGRAGPITVGAAGAGTSLPSEPARSTAPKSFADVLASLPRTAPDRLVATGSEPAPARPALTSGSQTAPPLAIQDPLAALPPQRLSTALGLPSDLLEVIDHGLAGGLPLDAALLEAFRALEPAPPLPTRPGSLVVVVGAVREARKVAVALAHQMAAEPSAIAVVSSDSRSQPRLERSGLWARSIDQAAEEAPSWRRGRVGLCVVDHPVGTERGSWTRELLAVLRPAALWGAVGALHKVEDVVAWASSLGGLDALAIEQLAVTVSPGDLLASGMPVGLLDGRPATPARWAAAMEEALARWV